MRAPGLIASTVARLLDAVVAQQRRPASLRGKWRTPGTLRACASSDRQLQVHRIGAGHAEVARSIRSRGRRDWNSFMPSWYARRN